MMAYSIFLFCKYCFSIIDFNFMCFNWTYLIFHLSCFHHWASQRFALYVILVWVTFTTELLGRNRPHLKKRNEGVSKSLSFKSRHSKMKFSVLFQCHLPLQKHLFCLFSAFPPEDRMRTSDSAVWCSNLETSLQDRCILSHFLQEPSNLNTITGPIIC